MLPVPKLDNRTFQEMIREATKRIPRLYDTWTDENVHDPGITMLEMLTWLVEMQQFYIDQISERHERKFLKLMGEVPRPVRQASVMVTFDVPEEKGIIPQGTKLRARDEVFETTESMLVSPMNLERIIVRTNEEANDYTSSNDYAAVDFPAFGPDPKSGNQLYLAFSEAFAVGEEGLLYIDLFEDYPVKRMTLSGGTPFYSSSTVTWLIFGERDGVEDWYPLKISLDETGEFSFSGRFRFSVDVTMKPTVVYPAERKASYWITAVLDDAAFELAPFIRHVSMHTIEAVHQFTYSKIQVLKVMDNQVTLQDALSYRGWIIVQVENDQGYWLTCEVVDDFSEVKGNLRTCTVDKNGQTKETTLHFQDGLFTGAFTGRVQVIAYEPDFDRDRLIGQSSGLPNQELDIHPLKMSPERFVLQISMTDPHSGEVVWENWTRVEDFDQSDGYSRHFLYDSERSLITFGNHEQGRSPFRSQEPNIRIIAAHTGGTEKGNIKPGVIDGLMHHESHLPGVKVTNHVYGEGGDNEETVERVKNRLQRDWQDTPSAVSLSDIEALVKATPGLRVARAHVLPLYQEGLKHYPLRKKEGALTVVVLPYSRSSQPFPSTGFLKTVEAWLNKHRLIATKVHVIAPVYIRITVHVVIVVKQQAKSAEREVKRLLEDILTSFQANGKSKGWAFGRPVKKADLLGLVSQLPGLVYVQDLWLDAEGRGMKKDNNGNVILPPHGLVYSGDHDVEISYDEHV